MSWAPGWQGLASEVLRNGRIKRSKQERGEGTSLTVEQLRLCASTTGGTDLIPGRGTKIRHAILCGQKVKEKKKKKEKEVGEDRTPSSSLCALGLLHVHLLPSLTRSSSASLLLMCLWD